MLNNPKMRLEEIDSRLKELPKGTLTYKTTYTRMDTRQYRELVVET